MNSTSQFFRPINQSSNSPDFGCPNGLNRSVIKTAARRLIALTLVVGLAFSCGCEFRKTDPTSSANSGRLNQAFLSMEEPSDPIAVAQARESVADDQEIHIVGRIGGSAEPFVNGLAAFSLVDLALPDCAGGECSASSCSPEILAKNLATVKFVNAQGKPIPIDAREMLNVQEKSTVVVQGTAKRDQYGNLTVLAKKLFVRSR